MKVEFDINVPTTPFKVGDKIKIKNWENDNYQYVLISKVIFTGTWAMCEACEMTNASIDRYNYEGILQIESYSTDTKEKIPLRPGRRVLYPGFKLTKKGFPDSIDSGLNGVVIDKFPHKEITIDTKENIHKREAEWRSTCSVISKTGDWNYFKE